MSYVRPSEDFEKERETLKSAIVAMTEKLSNRVYSDDDWSEEHREKCNDLERDLKVMYLRVEKL